MSGIGFREIAGSRSGAIKNFAACFHNLATKQEYRIHINIRHFQQNIVRRLEQNRNACWNGSS
ncbi:MAG: hypothetical protein OSA95_00065 [Opitutales bacterium]|nr:hypothetical protein [Opitutales bacterium]